MIDFTKNPLFLAPMAGFTDLPFRYIAKKFGADISISEMISSNALVYENTKTINMLKCFDFEKPFIVQIAGNNEEIIKKAVLIINKYDFIDGIDLNCGCPVNKVIKQNSGAALLNDITLLKKIINTIKKYSIKKSLSVKIRLGFDKKEPLIIAKACEDSGADFISIHGRTRKQFYNGYVDYEAISIAKQSVKIPVIANGDINFDNFNIVKQKTKCDGLMIGRAAIGRPWIFCEIKNNKTINIQQKKEIILNHFDLMLKHYGKIAIKIFRKHLHEYSKGYKDATLFRENINHIIDENIMSNMIEEFFN